MSKCILIVVMCMFAAVFYGVIHDQATIRICSEYFHAFHGDTTGKSPTLMALYWGAASTWWGGAALGLLIAGVSRLGSGPKVEPREIVFPLIYLILFTMGAAILMGIGAGIAASNGWISMTGEVRESIPKGRHTAFLVNLWAHNASYVAGTVGGVFLAGWIQGRRSEHRRLTPGG
jgi:hypothetical protein